MIKSFGSTEDPFVKADEAVAVDPRLVEAVVVVLVVIVGDKPLLTFGGGG